MTPNPMEQAPETTIPTPFRLDEIYLVEAFFRRHDDQPDAAAQQEPLQVRFTHRFLDQMLRVTLEVEVWQPGGEARVKMAGAFAVADGVPTEILENFADINAPAILYPFVRETVASLTTRAGVPTVLIQPLNFIDMAYRRQQQAPNPAE